MNTDKTVIFIMGVSGSGKSSIGSMLADDLSYLFIDADDHHPESNIEKMSSGIPLTDSDRNPWLDVLNKIIQKHQKNGCVMACSALKEKYRIRLNKSIESSAFWVYLKGDYKLIYERMKNRQDHYMDAGMLKSQFEVLEPPKNALSIDIVESKENIVEKIKSHLL